MIKYDTISPAIGDATVAPPPPFSTMVTIEYFSPLNSNKKNIHNSESAKSSKLPIDIEAELEKYKKLFDKGLITKEAYEAKMNKLLDL